MYGPLGACGGNVGILYSPFHVEEMTFLGEGSKASHGKPKIKCSRFAVRTDRLADKGLPFNFPSTLFQDEDALIPLLCLLIAGFRLPPKGTVLRRDGRASQGCGTDPREGSSTADVVKGGAILNKHHVGTFLGSKDNCRAWSRASVYALQDSAKRWSPGCVNAAGKARQR